MIAKIRYIGKVFAQPGGRIGRRAFLIGFLIWLMVVPIIAVLPVFIIKHYLGYTLETFGNADVSFKLCVLGGYLMFFYFSFYNILSIHIKRLHDLNHLGWWLLGLPFYPILLLYISVAKGNPKENNFGEPSDM